MSADSSGLGKPDGGSSPGEMSSSTPEAGGVTEGKVDNACNSQAHSTTHSTQSQTNHTPIPAHTQSTDGTHQDCASCHGDKGAKVGEQKDSLTSVIEEVSNSEQKCIEQTSHLERIYVNPSVNNEDSESSTESNDQSNKLRLKAKEENQDKTFVIIYRRSENDPGDQSDEAVQLVKEVNHDKNQGVTSDTTRRPKGNEQKDNDTGAVPRVRGVKLEQNIGCKVTDIDKRTSKKENGIDDRAMQRVEDGKHDQKYEMKDTEKRPSRNNINDGAMQRVEDRKHDGNNEFKDSEKRPSGNDIDDEAMQRVEDRKLEQKYGNKDTEERPSGNEKNNDNRTKPSVKNEDNGDNDIEKRLIKYENNDKGDWTTKDLKEEHSDINRKVNQTEKESRENEKKDHPDKATQSASVKKCQRSEKSLEDNGSKQSQDKLSGNTNNDGEWTEGKKEKDKTRPTGLSGDPDMNPSNVNTDGTDSTVSWKDDKGTMQGAVMLATDNSRDKSMMKNEGLGQIAVTATDRESQTKFDKLKNELGETDKGTIENKGNYQEDGTNSISQIGDLKLSDNTASVLGYPCKNLDESDGGTKEIKGKGALANTTPKTQPSDRRDENHAYHQDEAGAVSSKPSHEALSFSQSQDDNTLLDKQIDEFIDSISTDINENREEWKKSTKEKMSFFLTKVMDGTLSQRSFDSCVTNSMPVKNFDSDIHITEKQTEEATGARRRQGAEGGPAATPHNLQNDPRKRMTKQHEELQYIDEEENPQEHLRQTDSSLKESLQKVDAKSHYGNKTSRAPDPPTGGTSLSKSCLPAISADGNSRSSSIKEKPGDLLKVAEEKSLGKKTSNAPDPPTGGTPLSKSCLPRISTTGRSIDCSSTTSQIDMDCKKNAEGVKTESLHSSTAGSSKRLSSEDHQLIKNENTIPPDNPSGMPFVESHFAFDTALSQREEKKEVWKHDYSFVVKAETMLKEEEWELQVECSPTEYLKLLFIFSNETLKMKAEKKFRSFKIILHEGHSMRLNTTCMCIKPEGRTKLDGLFIDDVLSACKSLFPLVHLKKMVLDQSTDFEEIENYCLSYHDACKKKLVLLFYNEKRRDEILVAVEHELQDFGNKVVKDLLSNKLATECPLEQENYNLIGYFVQSAALKDKDLRLFGLLKKNKYLAEKYQGMNVYGNDKWVVISGQTEIHKYLFEKVTAQSWSVPPSLKELLNNHEVVEFINQTIEAKHPNDPMIWMVAEQSGKSFLETFALHMSSAICGMKTVQHCFIERYFDDAYLQKEAFQLQELKGEKFRGKIKITDMKTSVKITGTVDVFEEFIALLLKESGRLKKPVCKTVKVKNRNILNFCETHHEDNFREWEKSVDISAIVKDEICGYAIKSSTANSDKMIEIKKELEMILSDITEITVVEEKIQLDLTRNREFRRQRCDIEKEWNVDTIVQGIPGQDWSVEDGYEWCFQNGQSFTLLTLKSALPAETDVILQPRPKLNVKGNQQPNIQKHMNRDWHVFEFEVEHGQSGKAKESLRKSLHDILQADVKRNKFQAIVFPVDLKVMEKIGWSKTHYLKQILYVVHEQFGSEPWRIFFLSENQADHKTNVETLEKSFEILNIKKTSLKIRVFPIEVNFKPAIEIEVKQGSLVQTKADVIVNTTSKELKNLQYGQISKSILDAAGSKLSEECRKKYPNGIKYSEVAVTHSFQLQKCKKIYHGGIPYFDRSLKPLKDFVWNCLVQASEDKIETIAFPAIGTGKLNYPSEDVAATMINTVREFSEKYPGTTLLSVYFVIYDEKTLKDFEKRNESGQKAEGFQSVPDQTVRVSVIGSGDKVKEAAKCLNDFIKEIKKKEENGNDTKPETAFQLSKENHKPEKSKTVVAGNEKTMTYESANQIEKCSDDGGSWDLIFVKKRETISGYSLQMTECKKHLEGFSYKKIICPFGNECQALVKFETQKDAENVLTNLKGDLFTFEKVPVQAVHSVKAKLGIGMIHFLKINNMTEEQVENETGARLDTKEWIITGSLLEIKQAEIFFRNKYCENPAPRNTNDQTCFLQKLPGMVLPEKSSFQCNISERNAIRHFYENVLSRLYCKEETDGLCYLSGKPEAIEEFSKALGCLYSKKVENVSLPCYTRVTKYPGVFCYYNKVRRELEIFAKYRERVNCIEEIILNMESEIPENDKIIKKKISEIQAIDSSITKDNKHVQDDHRYTMKADDFDTVCHFHKEFLTELRRTDKESNVHLTGHKDQIEKLKVVHKEIKDNFYSQELKCHGRDFNKIHEIYTQMTITSNVHIRIKSSGSTTTVHFTAKEKTEVEKMKSWFDDELKKMTKSSARPTETKRKILTPKNDCIIFQEGEIKVYAVKEDVLRIYTNAIVCPSNLQVGEYITRAAEVDVDKNRHLSSDIINIQIAPKLNSHVCIIKVPNWHRYAESNNPCEDCIEDIQSIVEQCLCASENFTSIAVPEFHSDKECRLPAVVCCIAFARGVQGFAKSHLAGSKTKALNIYYVDNNQVTIDLMKMCFNQEASWEYIADDKYSIFFLNSTFQVHVKKADIFKSTAYALAASQDDDIDSKRFIASYLYNMSDEEYMLAMRGLKAKNLPTIVPAPRKSDYIKVIHFLSPSWKTKPKRDHFKEHRKSMKTLLDCASQECSSVVVPLSGGQYTSLDTRKKIAEKTVIAVAEWCKENSKKSTNLNTIYFLNNDAEYIKTTIECFRNHVWQEEYSCVKRPPLSNF